MSETEKVDMGDIDEISQFLFNIICAVRGIDPKQVQSMAKFMDTDSVDETTYYPNQFTSIAIAQLRMFGQAFYRGHDWNEYDSVADLLGMGFKGLKGFKSEQYKDITSGQPNLSELRGIPAEVQQGMLTGIFNRGKKE